jgi:hypothetical protein
MRGCRSGSAVRSLEPRDQRRQLLDHEPSVVDRLVNVSGIGGATSSPTGDRAFNETTELHAHWRRAEAGAEGIPGLVADLDTRHSIARGTGTFLGPLFTLSSASSHVYVVDDVADALEECNCVLRAERSDAKRQECILGCSAARLRFERRDAEAQEELWVGVASYGRCAARIRTSLSKGSRDKRSEGPFIPGMPADLDCAPLRGSNWDGLR